MTSMNLLQAIGRIDPKMIDAAAPVENVQKKKRNTLIKWVSIAACFALIVSASLWLFVPFPQTSEQVAIYTAIKLEDVYSAGYIQVNDMSNFDKFTLESKIGDLYLEQKRRNSTSSKDTRI